MTPQINLFTLRQAINTLCHYLRNTQGATICFATDLYWVIWDEQLYKKERPVVEGMGDIADDIEMLEKLQPEDDLYLHILKAASIFNMLGLSQLDKTAVKALCIDITLLQAHIHRLLTKCRVALGTSTFHFKDDLHWHIPGTESLNPYETPTRFLRKSLSKEIDVLKARSNFADTAASIACVLRAVVIQNEYFVLSWPA